MRKNSAIVSNISVHHTLPDEFIDVPCGRCHQCEKRRMREYMIRLLYEYDRYPNSYFVTLTFNDENLEKFKDDPNKAVRLFLDRFRKSINDNKQVRHWFVAEYGSLHGRIHYHGILFNVPLDKYKGEELKWILEKSWKYGFVDISKVKGDGAMRYVSKYVTKSYSNYQKTPRIITSFGIGKNYLNKENLSFHKDGGLRPYILKNGYKIPLPRYYSSKIFNEDEKIIMLLERTLAEEDGTKEYIWNGITYPNVYEYSKARLATYQDNCRIGLSQKPKEKEDFINNSNLLKDYGTDAFTSGL